MSKLVESTQAQDWATHQTLFSDILSRPRPEWLIEGMLPQGSIVYVVGLESTAKSWVVQSWMASIATGRAWMNRDVIQGSVAYLALEGNPRFIVERFKAWELFHKVQIDERNIPLFENFNMNKPSDLENLLEGVRAGVSLVVIDTLAKFAGEVNMNNKHEVTPIVKFAQDIVRESGGTTSVVIVAHTTKGGDTGVAGSGEFNASSDLTWEMTKRGKSFKATAKKHKNSAEGEEFIFKLETVQLSEDISSAVLIPGEAEAVVTVSDANERIILESLKESGDWVSTADLLKKMLAKGMPRTSFYDARKALLEAGSVIERKNARGSDSRACVPFGFPSVHSDTSDAGQRGAEFRSSERPLKDASSDGRNDLIPDPNDEVF